MGLLDFFTRKSAAPAIDLEDLIYEVAEHRRDEDFHELYRQMRDREVFVPVDLSSLPVDVKPGQTIVTDSTMAIRMKMGDAPNGQGLALSCTKVDSPMVKDGYVGMKWLGILEMSLKVNPPLYGVVLQGERSWVALDLERIRYVLGSA
jgi:hypothetical protein